jgi:hypothetical protein
MLIRVVRVGRERFRSLAIIDSGFGVQGNLRQKRASASWICRPHWSHSRPSQIFGRIARVPLAPWFTSTVGPKLAPGKEEDGAPPMPAACLLPRLVVAAAVAAPLRCLGCLGFRIEDLEFGFRV